ncbi:MAG: site-specific integrase [Clostridia bacterium]|nr:site-specific integrase [Clostridia bacterium]
MAHGSIRKIGDKYEVTFDFGKNSEGKRIRKYKRFSSFRNARKALAEHDHAVEVKSFVMPTELTLGEWMDFWVESIIAPKSAYTTVYAYNNIKNKYIKPLIGQIKLQEINAQQIQKYLLRLSNDYHLSPNTVIKHYELLNYSMGFAYRQDYVTKNPLEKVERPKKHQYEAKFYTTEQLAELLTLVKGDQLELTVNLAAYFGLRRGEICGLTWEDADLENEMIYVRRTRTSAGSEIVEKDTKNRASTRKLAMPKTIKYLLEKEQKHQQQRRRELGAVYIDTDYIIVMDGGKPYRPNYLSQLFGEFLEKNNLPRIVLHELRHTFASLSNEAGIPEFNIGKALGHSTPSTTKKIYTHLFDPVQTSAINKVAEIVDDAVKQHNTEADRTNRTVVSVINEWNPMKFSDEDLDYKKEIELVVNYMLDGGDKQLLGKFIYDTFRESFGSRFFKCDEGECELIGKRMQL